MNRCSLKAVAGLALVVVVAYGASSWYAGRLARQSIEAWIAQANQALQSQWAAGEPAPVLRVDDYQQGIFSSSIRYAFEFQDDEGVKQTLGLQDDLQHGPWPLAAIQDGFWQPMAAYSRTRPLPGGPWQPWFDALADGAAPWQADSRVGFEGDVASDVRFVPVRTADQRLDFSGGTAHLDYSAQARQTTLSGQMAFLDLQDSGGSARVRLEGLVFDSQTTGSRETDLQSRQQLTFTAVRVTGVETGDIELRQPSFLSETARTGGLMDSRMQYDLAHLQAGTRDLGSLQLKASVEQLDVASLQALMPVLDDLESRDADAPLTPEEEQRLRSLLIPLLATAPRVSLDTFTWTTPQGQTDLQAQVQFRPVGDDAPQDLGGLIEHGIQQVTAHAGVSKLMLLEIVRQAQTSGNPDMVVALVSMMFDRYASRLAQDGLVQERDGQTQADVRYADGQVTVNGISMSPEAFVYRVGQALGLTG